MNEIYQKLAALSPERRRLLEQKLQAQGLSVPTSIPRRSADDIALPLSSAQQRLWFMQQLEPDTAAYNMNMVLRLTGGLDQGALQRAFATLVARHEPLRTRFALDAEGQPRQFVDNPGQTQLRFQDCQDAADPRAVARTEIETLVGTAYDLARPPVRALLLQIGTDEHVFALGMHHIISDRWSTGVLVRDLSAFYESELTGQTATRPDLRVQFGDWTLWQRRILEGPAFEKQLGYWTERLAGELPVLELPFDRPRGATASFSGAHYPVRLDRDLALRLRRLAAQQNVSLFTLLLAAFNVLLHLYSDSDDIVVGSEVANRDRSETQAMMGPFVNTLVLRNDLSGDPSFEELLQKVAGVMRTGLAHQDVPFERLVEALNPDRSLSELNPLFQVKFDVQHNVASAPALHGLEVENWGITELSTKYELRFNLEDSEPDVGGKVEYSSQLFDEGTIADMVRRFATLLADVANDPKRRLSTLTLLSPQEAAATIALGAGPRRDYPTGLCIHDMVADQALATPDALAVTDGETSLTYSELLAQASRIAAALIQAGVKPGHRVGLFVRRSAQMISGLIGIMQAGAAYVPLDAEYPADRLAFIAVDAGIDILLCDQTPAFAANQALTLIDMASLPEAPEPPRVACSDASLAYIIYTSGSTGRPKGVAVEHRTVVALMHWAKERFTPQEMACMLVPTSISFDLSVFELYAPLVMGGTLAVTDHFLSLPAMAAKVDITAVNTVPSLMQELLEEHRLPDTVRTATFCGEPLQAALVEKMRRDYPNLHIHNLYGPSEDTVFSTEIPLHGDGYRGGVVPIGVSLPNTDSYILDRAQRLRPPGLSGELYLGGSGVTRGYFGRPGQTAERFLPDPFSGRTGSRLYRTGDRIRGRADGCMEFLGRFDHQVKIRGLRIEIGEIEHNLEQIEGVAKAVVTVTTGADRQLAAFIEPREGTSLDETHLRRAIGATLPAHMVPTLWYIVPRLPQQPNGKVDRGALPALAVIPSSEKVQPAEGLERQVADAWAQVLGVTEVGAHDNFFKLGGHSLLAMRMIARLPGGVGGKEILRKLFEFPSLRDFAAALAAPTGASEPAQDAVTPLPDGATQPLSFAQQRLWTLVQLEPDSAFYNIPAAVRFFGPLDQQRLRHALEQVAARHEALRTRFLSRDGQPQIDIAAKVVLDFEALQSDETRLFADLAAEYSRPFDLESGPLFRVRLLSLGAEEHVLLFVIHHIVADAQSVNLLMREATHFYDGHDEAPLPTLSLHYGDYAAWQRRQDFDGEIAYWRETLRDAPPLLELPTDFPRGATQDFAGDSLRFELDGKSAARLEELAQQLNATPFMLVLSAFAILLSRYSSAGEVVIGTPVSQRPHAELENVVGLFVNTLALRLKHESTGDFAGQVATVRQTLVDGFNNQTAPFERIVDELAIARSWSHNPVFQAMFTWQSDEADAALAPAGLERSVVNLPQTTSKVDLTLDVHRRHDRLDCSIIYRTDLFAPQTIENLADSFVTLLKAVLEAPRQPLARLSLLSERQSRQIDAWNETATAYAATPATLHGLFARSAALKPAAIAVTDRDGSISYAALEQRASQLARHLAWLGVGRGARVGISMPRGIDLVAAMLAVLKTGAAYVPLDPNYPADRIAFIAEDATLALLLTDGAQGDFANLPTLDPGSVWADAPMAGGPAFVPAEDAGKADLAYIIYTSGSTGRPKGVSIEHGNAVAFAHWSMETFSRDQFAGMLASTSVCFDLSIFEIFVTLAAGGRLYIVDDLFELPDAPFADEITLINTVPTPMAELLRFGPLPARAATVCLAGEPLPPALAEQILADPSVKALNNLYGPSEDTTYSTGCVVTQPRQGIHIGKPITNTRAYVLDEEMQLVPIGMPGELYLSGQGIARGYHNRPDLTAERFLPNPYARDLEHATLYRTGDRVRLRNDGNLDYLGRADRQLKISGFRIEPGEIETALQRYPGVSGAAVDAWRDQTGYVRLAAWVETVAALSRQSLASYLGAQLPRHLVPTLFHCLDKLPRLPNGKLDRKALPDPTGAAEATTQPDELRTPTEQSMAAIWSALLGRADIGRGDNFFALGGDSILAIQVVARARREGMAIAPRHLFQFSTLEALAEAVATLTPAETTDQSTHREAVAGPAQRWFFEQQFAEPNHWNQAVLLRPTRHLDAAVVQAAMDALQESHPALRSRFEHRSDGWVQRFPQQHQAAKFERVSCSESGSATAISEAMNALQRSFDLANGPVWGAVLIDIDGGEQRLGIAAHHLVIDGVSWRILLDDLSAFFASAAQGEARVKPAGSSGFGDWTQSLAETTIFDGEFDHWSQICDADATPIPTDHPNGSNLAADTQVVELLVDASTTQRLLMDAPAAYAVKVDDMLLSALCGAAHDLWGIGRLRVILESHGRNDLFETLDLSRTVGWFTAFYPVLFETQPELRSRLLAVKESLRRTPNDGIGYGVLRHLKARPLPQLEDIAGLRFNYLGQTDNLFAGDAAFAPAPEPAGDARGPRNARGVLIDVNAIVTGGQLRLRWAYSSALHDRATIQALAHAFLRNLNATIDFALTSTEAGYTPADFQHMDFGQDDLEKLLGSL